MSANAKLITKELYRAGEDDVVREGDVVGVYNVEIDELTFLQLYLTAQDYTIAWPSPPEQFQYGNDTASFFISNQLTSIENAKKIKSTGYNTRVTFIVSDEIHNFRFRSFEKDNYNLLPSLSDESGQVSFARYDFECEFDTEAPIECTFSTGNPKPEAKVDPEMTFRLPRTHKLSKRAFRCITIDKHVHARKLTRHLQRNSFLDAYNALMEIAHITPNRGNGSEDSG